MAALFIVLAFGASMSRWWPHWISHQPPTGAGVAGGAEARMATEPLTIQSQAGGREHLFTVEVAVTDREHAVGLMFRTSLADDHGMLFHYARSQLITMWMRNTYIPLDMVFMAPDGTVVSIEENAVPHSENIISSKVPAVAVLEIAGGAAARLELKVGDKVRHRLFTTK